MKVQGGDEAGYNVDDFLEKLVEVNENSKGILLDDFVLTMSESVNKQPTLKPKVIKDRKTKLSKRCPYTIDWVDENKSSSGISSNNLTISSNLLTSTDK